MSDREQLELEEANMTRQHNTIRRTIINEKRDMSQKLTAGTATDVEEAALTRKHNQDRKRIISEKKAMGERKAAIEKIIQQAQSKLPPGAPLAAPFAGPSAPPLTTAPVKDFDRQIIELQRKVNAPVVKEDELNILLGQAKDLLKQVTDEYIRLAKELDKQLPGESGTLMLLYTNASAQDKAIYDKIKRDPDTKLIPTLLQKLTDMGARGGARGGSMQKSLLDELFLTLSSEF